MQDFKVTSHWLFAETSMNKTVTLDCCYFYGSSTIDALISFLKRKPKFSLLKMKTLTFVYILHSKNKQCKSILQCSEMTANYHHCLFLKYHI